VLDPESPEASYEEDYLFLVVSRCILMKLVAKPGDAGAAQKRKIRKLPTPVKTGNLSVIIEIYYFYNK